jgi:hypothetical protein
MTSNLTVKIGADIGGLQKELQKATSGLQSFQSNMMKVGGMIAGAFAVDKVLDFGKAVFDTTAKFQKFEAVLTNTLGSGSAAKFALNQITQFAAKTPYQVDELTESFVKLANQGFIPTIKQMTALGDLAASQGKTFNQLTEAIIDAQTGEFERLKEFGVRASKEGDKVSFTFKGVKTQVDFTSQSIREYILSLGKIEGVAGGMEAQSKTLGGGLSNLGDAFENLKLKIGQAAEGGGLFSTILDGIAWGIKKVTTLFEDADIKTQIDYLKALKEQRADAAREGDIALWTKLNQVINAGTESIREYYEANFAGEKQLEEIRKKAADAAMKTGSFEIGRPFQLDFGFDTKKGDVADTLGDSARATAQIHKRMISQLYSLRGEIKLAKKELQDFGAEWSAKWAEVGRAAFNAAPVINEAMMTIAAGMASAFGDMLSGVGNVDDMAAMLLGTIGNMAVQLGQLAIATGLAVAGIKKALVNLNPAVAIAAGVALIALGRFVSNRAASIATGGGGGGSSSGGGSAPGVSPSDYYKQKEVKVVGRIMGQDLGIINEKSGYRRSRLG